MSNRGNKAIGWVSIQGYFNIPYFTTQWSCGLSFHVALLALKHMSHVQCNIQNNSYTII